MFGLSVIPIIGPLFDMITSIIKGAQNVDIQKYIVDGKVDVAAFQAATNNIVATKDDIGVRFWRDVALSMPVSWSALIGWDTIWAKHDPSMMWHVASYPESVAYLPGLALGFLLGNIGLNIWRRR